MRSLYPIGVLLVGCTGAEGEPFPIDLREEATGVLAVGTVDPYDAVFTRPDGLFDHTGVKLDPTVSPVKAAVRHTARVVATDADLLVGDDALLPSPLEARLPGPVTDLAASGTLLWLRSADRWWVYRDGRLMEPMLDGAPLEGQLVAGRLDGTPVAWHAGSTGLVAFADSADGLVVVVRSELVATDLAAAADGLWATTEQQLHHFDGRSWQQLGRPADRLVGHPAVPGAWIQRADDATFATLDTEVPVDVPGAWIGSDAAGRLWTLDDAGTVRRAAHTPLVRLTGLRDDALLDEPVVVGVDVTHTASLTDLEVLVDDAPVTVQTDDTGARFVVLDPVLLGPGEHTLIATATWSDHVDTAPPVPFQTVVTGPITWIDHVQPLYRARCSACHDNGTETILIGQQEWIATFDRILVEVEAGRMPIGSDPLDAASIGLLHGWRDAGFP
jgi:hypothetical protein